MIIAPQCFQCRHRHPDQLTCDAFPQQIPEPILLNVHDHREPFPGDHGIRFEPITATKPSPTHTTTKPGLLKRIGQAIGRFLGGA